MSDTEKDTENNLDSKMQARKTSSMLLKEIAIDYEEQLYSVKLQLKTKLNQLQEKEQELSERDRTKTYNRDLFSPINNTNDNTAEILISIEQLKRQMDDLTKKQQSLTDKINGLKTAIQSNDLLNESVHNQNEKDKIHRFNDNGLSLLEAQEIERQRIARDLHDTTVQNLTSMVHKAELCIKLIEIDTVRAKLELNTMSNTIKTVINDMRGIIYNLKPMTLDDLGLTITVKRYANKLMDLNNIRVEVHSNDETNEILPVIKLTLFRIIQEACCNVLKHANATLISIEIYYEEHRINVTVSDDGTGFSTDKFQTNNSEQTSSFGLSIMKERISLLSGTLDIQSEKGKGTTITVSVPLINHEEDKNE